MIQDQKRINSYKHNHLNDLQQQYIKAVTNSEELKKKLEKIEVKVNFAIAHLNVFAAANVEIFCHYGSRLDQCGS
jgi:tetrahydromethanopterin S-methyltransferase subunit G